MVGVRLVQVGSVVQDVLGVLWGARHLVDVEHTSGSAIRFLTILVKMSFFWKIGSTHLIINYIYGYL